ncbi:hypothetical protein [Pseudomonas putida]|uniref:Phosphoribosylamidoimidazolesuccinocarboxamide synthase n=1 Tax=Pseudomonas putida TaxID=303 RepID=A0A1L7NPQ1_PSEPU|nr:hypothetical protein [Pseudomonas putida]BAW27448.1 Phosphoribosylamidoimidazolesuccinocarboxamide synthase [Pseudomonas putida]
MAAKTTTAKARGVKAAPAGDQVDGAVASSTAVQATAGIAPAAGAADGNNQGPGEGSPPGGEAQGGEGAAQAKFVALAPVAHQMVKTQELVALTLALDPVEAKPDPELEPEPGKGPETGDAEPNLADSESPETVQTPAEKASPGPVILGLWSLPEIDEFPATLTLTNHTASRFVVLGNGIPVGESIELEVTEQQFSKLAKSLRGHVQLDKWDNVRGLQVAHESTD